LGKVSSEIEKEGNGRGEVFGGGGGGEPVPGGVDGLGAAAGVRRGA
jgi:hypothetical protein